MNGPSTVKLEKIKDRSQSDEQRWVRETAAADGWFRFKNPLSGKVLSVQTFSSIAIAGNSNISIIKVDNALRNVPIISFSGSSGEAISGEF